MDASYIVAGLLVCFYAWTRFNTPRTVRSQTSRFQFFASGTAYVLSCLGLLLGLSWVLRHQPAILAVIHTGGSGQLPGELNGLDAALVAALILTTLLPSFPVMRDVDQRMLAFFHKMGQIPFNALVWAQRMGASPIAIPEHMVAAARQYIFNSDTLPNSLVEELQSDPNGDRAHFQFTRNLVLYVAMSQMRYRARFANEFPEDVARFEKHLSDYFTNGIGFFALTRELSQQQLAAVAETRDSFKRMSNAAFDAI